jgi:hypothetical protein
LPASEPFPSTGFQIIIEDPPLTFCRASNWSKRDSKLIPAGAKASENSFRGERFLENLRPSRSRPSDEPDATPAFRYVTDFTKLGWILHFAQCARNEIHIPAQISELQRADRLQSDMVGLDF